VFPFVKHNEHVSDVKISRAEVRDMWTLQQVDDLELLKDDLIAILAGRYGLVPDSVYGYIQRLSDTDTVHHLIAVALSSHTWADFVRELKQGAVV
jgi:hypothetical protein